MAAGDLDVGKQSSVGISRLYMTGVKRGGSTQYIQLIIRGIEVRGTDSQVLHGCLMTLECLHVARAATYF